MNTIREKRLYELIGDNIKKLRIEKGLNQTSLASKINLSRTSVVNIEQGRQHPSIYLLFQIANCLQTDIIKLLPQLSDLKTVGITNDVTLPNMGSETKNSLLMGFKEEATKPVSHES